MSETILYLIRHSESLKMNSEYYSKEFEEKYIELQQKHFKEEELLKQMLIDSGKLQEGLDANHDEFHKLHLNQLKEIEKIKEEANSEQLKNEQIILSVDGEKKAYEMSLNKELENIDMIYSSNYVRAISTAKFIALRNNLEINVDDRLGERKLRGFSFSKRVRER